ncbi:MAG: JAB domain-containing protein [Bacteroidetes bacterium]|nr:JAB domain-containing protein [Bacteroidota bacterium]
MSKQTKQSGVIINVPEIELKYNSGNFVAALPKIKSSEDASKVLRNLYDKEEIELHEVMFVLYLNRGNKPLGFYKHTVGGRSSGIVDTVLILATAVKSLASAFILAHNHPGGNPQPSDNDLSITRELAAAAKLLRIQFVDHIIMTKESHNSFADSGLLGFQSTYHNLHDELLVANSPNLNKTSSEMKKKAGKIERELRKL